MQIVDSTVDSTVWTPQCGVADKKIKDFRLLKSATTTDSYLNEVRKFLSPTVADSSVKPGNLLIFFE